ncbi:MAG: hypothetical protein M3O32_14545, partial [Actinomycetota bacterium]|nr:hypothetical protein [Actinomycetota bacterium]
AVAVTAVNSAGLPGAQVGVAGFTGENHWTLLPLGRPVAVVGAVVQAAAAVFAFSDTGGYGVSRNAVSTSTDAPTGYVGVRLGFPQQLADQNLEAEAVLNGASTTASQVADGGASGGQCIRDTQTAWTAATLFKASLALASGARYRIVLRVRVDAGATGSYVVPGTAGIVTTTSSTWVELDAGELPSPGGGSLSVAMWRSAGGGAVYVDQVKFFKLEDRAGGLLFDGARDLGQSVLMDCRSIPVLIERDQ